MKRLFLVSLVFSASGFLFAESGTTNNSSDIDLDSDLSELEWLTNNSGVSSTSESKSAAAATETDAVDSNDPNVKVNLVEVIETFYKIVQNTETNEIQRIETTEAKPGDLIELVITAENKSDEVVNDVELVNNIPSGPVTLVENSFTLDPLKSLIRISNSGDTFFPIDAGLDVTAIRFVQWSILTLEPSEIVQFSYRIQISQ